MKNLQLYNSAGLLSICLAALLQGCASSESATPYKYTYQNDSTEYSLKNGQYVLPVICHVFYTNKQDSTYIPPERISHIFAKVNEYYSKNNINVSFKLTTLPPQGKGLDYPGVEYVQWNSKEIDKNEVMGDESVSKPYKTYLWDPNKYINVMFYAFKPEDVNNEYITLGISHLPLTFKGTNSLRGLQEVDSLKDGGYFTLQNIQWAPCSSINSKYAYDESTDEEYHTTDVTVTVAHELGHYLGLLHTFTENEEGEMVDDCYNSDYCDDTPSYDRTEYLTWLDKFLEEHKYDGQLYMKDVAKRTSCEVGDMVSHNIMDYYMSFTDEFTNDQKERINNVLIYSPMMPGNYRKTRGLDNSYSRKLNVRIPVIKEPLRPAWRRVLHK